MVIRRIFFVIFFITSSLSAENLPPQITHRIEKARGANQGYGASLVMQIQTFYDACQEKYGWFYLADFLDNNYLKEIISQHMEDSFNKDLLLFIEERIVSAQPAEDVILAYFEWLEDYADTIISFDEFLTAIYSAFKDSLLHF
jgi:hypothetical protein